MTTQELNQVVSSLAIVYLQKSSKLSAASTPQDYIREYAEAVKTFTEQLRFSRL